MRQITKEASNSFIYGKNFNKANTKVEVMDNGDTRLYLHGHNIALFQLDKGTLHVTNCGYFTNTTKERLNGLLGVNICQKKGKWYLNGKEWNGEWTTVNAN